LFVGSQNGTVYSLDAASGCIAWTFSAHGGVRASVTIGPLRRRGGPGRGPTEAAYVADQQGYVYALDASNGRLLWSRKVDDHPLVRLTGSPTLFAGRLYVPTSSYEEGGKPPGYSCCTFRGSVVALDAATGEQVWKSYTIPATTDAAARVRRRIGSVGSVGRRHLVVADHRCEARRVVRRRWQQLQRSAAGNHRRRCSRSISRPARSAGRTS
jgi:polyvinyl alcohol dehydrogenase (cytochrome)